MSAAHHHARTLSTTPYVTITYSLLSCIICLLNCSINMLYGTRWLNKSLTTSCGTIAPIRSASDAYEHYIPRNIVGVLPCCPLVVVVGAAALPSVFDSSSSPKRPSPRPTPSPPPSPPYHTHTTPQQQQQPPPPNHHAPPSRLRSRLGHRPINPRLAASLALPHSSPPLLSRPSPARPLHDLPAPPVPGGRAARPLPAAARAVMVLAGCWDRWYSRRGPGGADGAGWVECADGGD
ncbi:hypothetical protein FB567DRAFT_599894 [Paraphoma chrysanthemicola]|uniref:Uncharacterized protein n=1 Tax=Paraphoma chrysanthemicola TaxID=798071 RepID=A0A8K0RG52_9PLEO|nr:hypothetical protein FB567DRAFT_599894 [Paraphoma chrysanthemicola]